jgi:PleD family two-component response regulator
MLEVAGTQRQLLGYPPKVLKTLLLDDDAFDRTRIRRFTEKSGLNLDVEEVCSINEMSDVLDQSRFDVIMVDYQLAEGDGLQALKIIQSHEANKGAATIMVTGQEQTEIALSAFRQGCNDFLQKDDLSPSVIHSVFMKALQQNEMRRSLLNPDPRDMRDLMQAALQDAGMREMIETALSEGLRKSIDTTGVMVSAPQYSDQFLDGFLREDEFVFKN